MHNLAIIIPFYKITFFEQILNSLALQTDKRFTVYIGDDGSHCDCSKVISDYNKNISIKYHRFENNLGKQSLVKHWLRCYEMIDKEEWILFLGDDDVLGDNCVEEFYKNLPEIDANDVNIIRFSSILIDAEDKPISHQYKFPITERTTSAYINKAKRRSRASLSEHVLRRAAFKKVGFVDLSEAWHTDDLLILEISDYGIIYTLNNSIARIRYSNISVSGNPSNGKRKMRATRMFLRYLIGCKMLHFSKNERYFIVWYYFKRLKHSGSLSRIVLFDIFALFVKNGLNIRPFITNPIKLK